MGWENVEHIWEQVKRAMVESAREVCGSVRVGGGNPKSVWWNDQIKAAVKSKEVLGARTHLDTNLLAKEDIPSTENPVYDEISFFGRVT